MRKQLLGLLAAAVTVAVVATSPAAATGATPNPARLTGHQVAAFDTSGYAGAGFLESMAPRGNGTLVASLTYYTETDNYGQLFTVTPGGSTTPLGPLWDVGCTAMFLGVAVDRASTYVVLGNYATAEDATCPDGTTNSPTSGVYRVTPSGFRLVMQIPPTAMPNGLLIHDGTFYVTDSHQGAVWSGPVSRTSAPRHAWFTSPLLMPNDVSTLGANGIAWHDDSVYVTGYAQAVVVRVPVTSRGHAGPASTYASSPLLFRADGIAFDACGRLWVAVNPDIDWDTYVQVGGGALAVVGRNGAVTIAHGLNGVLDYPELDYPTQPVISSTGTVYVSNGSFLYGTPTIEAFTS